MNAPANPAGAFVSFPYDRAAVDQFRQSFPRARWNDEEARWFVPGKTAEKRFFRWMDNLMASSDPFADEKGMDDFAFDPIVSPYLAGAEDLQLRTPYSRAIVRELRQVPWARWDDALRLWRIPYRSLQELRKRWPTIETEAQRNEPEERKMRRRALQGSAKEQEARARVSERRRRRYPVPRTFPPMLNRPVATATYGVVICNGVSTETVPSGFSGLYPHMGNSRMEFVWASWRVPTLSELVSAWPARAEIDHRKGWWLPTLDELRDARKQARSRERRHVSAAAALVVPSGKTEGSG
ncbi:hypothetical protein IB238_04015 [Rhizobium sp. ARZ01]|nr:hypothetical protein [Rhizobium sp. ARZ01]